MPFSAPVLTYRAKALASNMCSKVLNGHIILTDTSITTILAPEMTYTPKKTCGRNPVRRTNSDASFCFVRKFHEESPKSRTGLHSFRTSHVPGPFSRRRPQGSPYKKARTQVLTPYGRPCEPFTVVFPTPKPVPRPNGQGQGSSFRQNLYRE